MPALLEPGFGQGRFFEDGVADCRSAAQEFMQADESLVPDRLKERPGERSLPIDLGHTGKLLGRHGQRDEAAVFDLVAGVVRSIELGDQSGCFQGGKLAGKVLADNTPARVRVSPVGQDKAYRQRSM
jgi:hypothetical protein